ncbi:Glycosyltransferase involved in cell wall bisynthesis [Devosia enhydra]|uniref:Glycosyltransferase involved in cell wall bisynthesis n=1 Tax=Devosia enhydra TaxID=665118 RepID=A0A1K2I0U7_9HYPH|nr:glycosyltransferase [Devosia enhydra]SFZ85945.1 Glycosyltransferase involved in cell wall bisynthesis [Devosia enhydra]
MYLTRNGLLEPLGKSQVLAYLRGLAQQQRIILITREKPEDWADAAAMATARAQCSAHNIDWRPRPFRARPRLVAPALDMLGMGWQGLGAVLWGKARLIHARSYIPAAIALVLNRLTGTPFIFDMRALWPEELITAGRLRRGSLLHRAIAFIERACIRHAAATVSLTEAAAEHLHRLYPRELAGRRLIVIPTCADLSRFVPATIPPSGRVIGCLGTVLSGWFRIDWLAAFIRAAAARDPSLTFMLTTRDDPAAVRAALALPPELAARVSIAPANPAEIPAILHQQLASVMFYAGGEVSELGRSPTRMAEILGCGLPVLANAGVGDVARIIAAHRVGVIAEGSSPQQMAEACDALLALLADPDLARRCRTAAEEIFSLEAGTAAYRAIYAAILAPETDVHTTSRDSTRMERE